MHDGRPSCKIWCIDVPLVNPIKVCGIESTRRVPARTRARRLTLLESERAARLPQAHKTPSGTPGARVANSTGGLSKTI